MHELRGGVGLYGHGVTRLVGLHQLRRRPVRIIYRRDELC